MIALPNPIGFDKDLTIEESLKALSKMAFKIDAEGNVPYHSMLYASLKRIYGVHSNPDSDKVAAILLEKEEKETIKKIKKLKKKSQWLISNKSLKNQIRAGKRFKRQKTKNLFVDFFYFKKVFDG